MSMGKIQVNQGDIDKSAADQIVRLQGQLRDMGNRLEERLKDVARLERANKERGEVIGEFQSKLKQRDAEILRLKQDAVELQQGLAAQLRDQAARLAPGAGASPATKILPVKEAKEAAKEQA